jgi:hypothetical protein
MGGLHVLSQALSRVTRFVVRITPLGVFAIGAVAAGTMTLAELERLQVYLVTFLVAASLLAFWVIPPVEQVLEVPDGVQAQSSSGEPVPRSAATTSTSRRIAIRADRRSSGVLPSEVEIPRLGVLEAGRAIGDHALPPFQTSFFDGHGCRPGFFLLPLCNSISRRARPGGRGCLMLEDECGTNGVRSQFGDSGRHVDCHNHHSET